VSAVATTLAARWRGAATGVLTATLSLVAHTAGGGALPSGTGAALLAVMAATLGALAATMPAAATRSGLFLLVAAGQVLGHLLLEAAGHQHVAPAPTSTAMVVAHVAAVFAGAALIAAATRLADALSRAVRAVTARVQPPVGTRPFGAVRTADQPLRSALALAASVSHRGPPVGRTR
jgi:hypothetical protein